MKASIKNRGATKKKSLDTKKKKLKIKTKEGDNVWICPQSAWNGSSKGLALIPQLGTGSDNWLKCSRERPDMIFNTN